LRSIQDRRLEEPSVRERTRVDGVEAELARELEGGLLRPCVVASDETPWR